MSKFILKNILSQSSQENVAIDVLRVENHKSKKNVEVGVKARPTLGDPNLASSANQYAFRKNCFKFYSTAQNICRNICLLMCLLFVMHT